MSLSHGFFIIELLLTLVLVTWFMGMIMLHNVSCINQQTHGLNNLKAMDRAHNILGASVNDGTKQLTVLCNTIQLRLELTALPAWRIADFPPSLNLSCLESLALAHVTATTTASKIPMWRLSSIVAGHAL